jgi:hypothetical protein
MFRILTSLVAGALCAGFVTLGASAQQMPPPEGPPQGTNPYGQPYGQPNAPPDTTSSNQPNPKMLAKAKIIFAEVQTGRVDRSQLSTQNPNANMTDATITNGYKMVNGLGAPVSFVQQRTSTQGNLTAALYLITFKNGEKLDFLFILDSEGKVAGMGLGTPR